VSAVVEAQPAHRCQITQRGALCQPQESNRLNRVAFRVIRAQYQSLLAWIRDPLLEVPLLVGVVVALEAISPQCQAHIQLLRSPNLLCVTFVVESSELQVSIFTSRLVRRNGTRKKVKSQGIREDLCLNHQEIGKIWLWECKMEKM